MLYIISCEKYLNHYKSGFKKYMPYSLIPRMKPDIMGDITRKDKIVGKVAGLNTKPIDFKLEKDQDEYIRGIRKLGIDKVQNIYLEEMKYIPKNIIEHIEKELNVKILNDIDIKILHLSLVIKRIYKYLKSNIQNKEVLIISKDKERSKQVIKAIGKEIKFVTNVGCGEEDSEEIYNYILEEIGLSIFQPADINKVLGKYSIVINLVDNLRLEEDRIRSNAIIFDFSFSNETKKDSYNEGRNPSIRDFGFKLKNLGVAGNRWIGHYVDSNLYSMFNGLSIGEVKGLYIGKDFFTIDDYVNTFIKRKGNL